MSVPPRTARQVAFRVLEQWQARGQLAAPELDRLFSTLPDLSAADRGLANELSFGVIRRRETLEALLRPQLKRPPQSIESPLWTLLQLGAYQLLFFASSSQHAAVHETVELTRWLKQPRWTGFANAVLRALQRDLLEEFTSSAAADALLLQPRHYRRLARPHLPDPAVDPAGYIALAGSLPGWLVQRWSRQWDFDELLRLAAWFNSPAPIWLRVNPLTGDPETIVAQLAERKLTGHVDPDRLLIRLEGTTHVPSLPGFSDGRFTVQDATAAAAAVLLDPRPGQLVLDLCAAPGAKSTHLAELMQDTGRVVAADSHPGRLERISPAARRLGLSIIEPTLVDVSGSDLPGGPFDAILVDVPCSNTGVLGKRPEARWRLDADELARLANLQLRLLESAAERLVPGGRLVYSTCSIEPEENQGVVERFLAQHDQFHCPAQQHHVPGAPADGGYQALLLHGTASTSAGGLSTEEPSQ